MRTKWSDWIGSALTLLHLTHLNSTSLRGFHYVRDKSFRSLSRDRFMGKCNQDWCSPMSGAAVVRKLSTGKP